MLPGMKVARRAPDRRPLGWVLWLVGGLGCASSVVATSGDVGSVDAATPPDAVPDGLVAPGRVPRVIAGLGFTCALRRDGVVRCWGTDTSGQFGNGSMGGVSSRPETSRLVGEVVDLFAGGGHACARARNATLRCWGFNDYGQVGDGTTRRSPPRLR